MLHPLFRCPLEIPSRQVAHDSTKVMRVAVKGVHIVDDMTSHTLFLAINDLSHLLADAVPSAFLNPHNPCMLPCEALWKVKWMPSLCMFISKPSQAYLIPQCSRILWHNIFFYYISPVRHLLGCLSNSWWQFSETGISDPVFPGVGFSWWLSGKESACQCRRLQFGPWVRKIPWRWTWQPTPVFLSGGLQSMWLQKSWTQLSS